MRYLRPTCACVDIGWEDLGKQNALSSLAGVGELQDHGLQPAAGGPRAGQEGGEPRGPRGQP